MHPVLAHVGPVVLHSYGVCLVLALSCALIVAALLGTRTPGIKLDHVMVPLGIGAFLAMFGARAAFIAAHWSMYQHRDVVDMLTHGGLTYWGAVLTVAVTFAVYSAISGLKLPAALATADVL
ncbi:MAG TPA: prolipoprotein diacylglyceryl transferase family protein, partial [Myxococcota bacterium]